MVHRYDYWRGLFPSVTPEAIKKFQGEFQGSEEETEAVLKGKEYGGSSCTSGPSRRRRQVDFWQPTRSARATCAE
jgi:hypothetical protein